MAQTAPQFQRQPPETGAVVNALAAENVPGPSSSGDEASPSLPSNAPTALPSAAGSIKDTFVEDEILAGSATAKNTAEGVSLPAVSHVDGPPETGDPQILLSKFTLYETKSYFYIVGSNFRETRFRVLLISLKGPLEFSEPHGVLTRAQVMKMLDKLELEAKAEGGTMSKRQTAWGILGCIRFTDLYYLCLVTKCSPVALLGGHYIFHIDETKLIPIVHSSVYRQPDRRSPEDRLLGIFNNLELSKTFYFSPSYDVTQTLQTNLLRERLGQQISRQELYVWNVHLLQPVIERFGASMDWCLSIIHGYIDQSKISVFGSSVFITLIARRSHYFAGARYLKRGINNEGHVANEVETEQIVSNHLTSSFHDPRFGPYSSPRYTSYVQHRGSISLRWSQYTSNMSPKPPIHLDGIDPYYIAAAKHFDNLMGRYGAPVRVLNLVKQKERRPRESILGREFEKCIVYLNKFLPPESKINYTAWDMSRASKGPASEVIEYLDEYAQQTLEQTQFFHNGTAIADCKLQQGICRTNCIDCLDRTNAAQSVVAKCALGHQLYAIGIIDTPHVDLDTDIVDLLTEMWHDHGDTIAIQYGGSNLVNTVETYRKINQWSSHSRDLIESIRRFYSNSFIDAQRQDAINLFLGNYQFHGAKGINLWDLSTDYYLHNVPSLTTPNRSYREWFTPWNLRDMRERIEDGTYFHELEDGRLGPLPSFVLQFEHYWTRIYRPRQLTSLGNVFVMRMNSTERYKKSNSKPSSPFEVHKGPPGATTPPLPEAAKDSGYPEKGLAEDSLKHATMLGEPNQYEAFYDVKNGLTDRTEEFEAYNLEPVVNPAQYRAIDSLDQPEVPANDVALYTQYLVETV